MAKRTYRTLDGLDEPSNYTDRMVSRRDVLKTGAMGLGALGLGQLFGATAQAAPNPNRIGALNTAAPGFTPLPSTLITGAAADISIGWDGSTWATDDHGLLHSYDPLAQSWQPFGTGIDAVTAYPNSMLFRGAEVWEYVAAPQQPPQPIGTRWPTLPAAFKLGVDGAIVVADVMYLFKHGRYVRADMQQPERQLSQLAGWPGAWSDGLVDAMGIGGVTNGKLLLIRGQEYAIADLSAEDMSQHRIASGPAPLSAVFGPRLLELLSAGVDTLYFVHDAGTPDASPVWVFGGPLQWTFTGARDAQPATKPVWTVAGASAAWPQHWTPQLAHAPGGRAQALWAATTAGGVVGNDGASWSVAPPSTEPVRSAAVGVDGTVYAVTAGALLSLSSAATPAWQQLAAAPGGRALTQATAGDSGHVWARDDRGQVLRWGPGAGGAPGSLQPLAGVTASHVAAGYDGTLWHCNDSANAYRLITAGSQPSERLAVAGANPIVRVSTTGYGTSLVLDAAGNAYTYQSPYVFKTAKNYEVEHGSSIAHGQNCIFIRNMSQLRVFTESIVALDAQSGDERWAYQVPRNTLTTNPAYDVVNQAVIWGDVLNGQVTAVAADTKELLWSFQTVNKTRVSSDMAIDGNLLVFGDEAGRIYAIDTVEAIRSGAAGRQVDTLWPPYQVPTGSQKNVVLAPLLADGKIYVVVTGSVTVLTVLNLAGEREGWRHVHVGAGVFTWGSTLARADIKFSDAVRPAVVMTTANVLCAISTTSAEFLVYHAKPGNHFTTNPSVHNNHVYAGDNDGYLYALDQHFRPLRNTPVRIDSKIPRNTAIIAQPVVVEDEQNNVFVLVAPKRYSAVWAYEVSSPTPTLIRLMETGQTPVKAMSLNPVDGTVYVGGQQDYNNELGQVFGLRVDAAISNARAFMIESQLMQDFDDPPGAQPNKPQPAVAVARYQTSLTVVDEHRAPRPFEAVKIWAEQPGTLVSIDGVQRTIGPGDNDCAITRTDAGGQLTIISGSLPGDTDPQRATDLFAVPLRVWAGFMDPFERIVVFPDRAFHTRMSGTIASSTAPDDPDTINLATARDYNGAGFRGPPLFNNQQQNAQQIAEVIRTVSGSTNLGPQPPTAQASAVADAEPGKYFPDGYNLPSMAYFAANVPATQPAEALAPAGLSFVGDGSNINFTTLSVADASAAIDALEGKPWTTLPGLQAGAAVGASWSSLWNYLKRVGAGISNLVVGIGKQIYAGIRFVVDGIPYVFQNVLQSLQDLVSMVGTFFVKLGKAIKNVVEAIAIAFNFERIRATQEIIRTEYLRALEPIEQEIRAVQRHVDSFFATRIKDLDKAVEDFINDFAPRKSTPLSNFGGIGKTEHDAFSIGQGGGPGQSRTLQCSWVADKVRVNIGQSSGEADALAGVDPILDYFESFLESLKTNEELRKSFEATSARFDRDISITSPKNSLPCWPRR